MKLTIISGIVIALVLFRPLLADTIEKVYDNGLKLIVLQDDRAPVVVSQLWYHVGASYEHGGITGISHALEHLMFKSTDDAEAGEFSRLISERGGSDNAFTSQHYTTYFQLVASDSLELCIKYEADRMNGLVFDTVEFEREIDVIREERSLRVDSSPLSQFYEQFTANVYIRSPLRHPVIGWPEDIQQLRLEEVKQWYKRWYVPNNATLVIAGDVRFEEVDALVTKFFSVIPSRALQPVKNSPEPPQNGLKLIEGYGQTSSPYLLMAFRAPGITQLDDPDDAYALEVLGGILDGGASARFSRYLQREQEIAVSASVSYDPFERLQGLFSITAVPSAGVTLPALQDAILQQLESLKAEAVSEEELNRVKAQVISSKVYERDSLFYSAMQIGRLEAVGLDRQLLDRYVSEIERVDADDVRRVAQSYFVETGMSVGRFRPQGKRP